MLVSSLVVVLAIYATGLARLWRSAGVGHGIRRAEALAFVLGWFALAAAVSPPLHEWSERWLSAHMVQHELLMAVAAPLIVLGAPIVAMLWALPARTRPQLGSYLRHQSLRPAWSAATSPGFVFLLYGLALWIWHLPALYDAALAHEWVHGVQHLSFFGTATLFWWGIAHSRHGRGGYGAAVVYVFVTAIHGGLLGALLTLSPHVWYAPYLAQHSHHATGLSPLEDQQLAGLLMWIPASLAFVASGLYFFAEWLRQSDRLSRFNPGPALGPTRTR